MTVTRTGKGLLQGNSIGLVFSADPERKGVMNLSNHVEE